jgi:hypothetical protein
VASTLKTRTSPFRICPISSTKISISYFYLTSQTLIPHFPPTFLSNISLSLFPSDQFSPPFNFTSFPQLNVDCDFFVHSAIICFSQSFNH